MTITGNIFDKATSENLIGASVVVVDPAGKVLGDGTATDQNGDFSLTSPQLGVGAKLMISAVSYRPVIVDPSVFLQTGYVGLDQDADELTAAVVTAHKRSDYTPLILAGGGLLLLASSDNKKSRSMGGVDIDWTKILLYGGGAIAAYFVVLKPIMTAIGIFGHQDTQQDKDTKDAQKSSLDKAKQDAANSGKTGATYSAAQYQGWANDIWEKGTRSTVDQQGIMYDVINVNTDVDLYSLISAFGIKQGGGTMCELFNMYCHSYDLPTFLKEVMNAEYLGYINQYLSAQGINYRF